MAINRRKPASKLRRENIHVLVTLDFLKRLDALAEGAGKTRSEFCRSVLEAAVASATTAV